jgi:signal transduction histidine kinase
MFSSMSSNEIRPKQLRALLLLLFIVPLIPTALMARFMFDALNNERLRAFERIQQLYTDSLPPLLRYIPSSEGTTTEHARDILSRVEKTSENFVTVRIVDANGKLIAGEPNPWGQLIAQAAAPGIRGATVQLHIAGPRVIDEAISGQRQILIWTGSITALAVLLIAGLATLTVSRQLALHELKNTSVATVAHELRTPLASMRLLIDTLRAGRVRDEKQRLEYLDLIASENERLSKLAENFLTFSRYDRGELSLNITKIAPQTIAEQAVSSLRPRLDEATFTIEAPENLPQIHADRDALAQVLTNLLDNALKYTGEEKHIALRISAVADGVVFAVEDNGIGLTHEERQEIFRPFYQADQKLSRTREGCGLGLAIVNRIVKAHRGEITVASEPGKGSVFRVKIPTV